MREKYTCFAVPKAIAMVTVWASFVGVGFGAFIFAGTESAIISVIAGMLTFFAVNAFWMCFYFNAYTKIYMTKEGVGNRKIFIKWGEIETYRVLEACRYYGAPSLKLKLCDMVCLGDVKNDDFWHQETRRCVYFPLTKKSRKMISKLCEEKNETILDIIGWEKIIKK